MKITINIDDFYLEGEELESGLKEQIKRECISQISASIEKKVKDFCDTEIKKQIEETLYKKVSLIISNSIANDKVKGRYNSKDELTIEEWVKEQIKNYSMNRGTLTDFVSKIASNFGIELKNRYDILFASQLVSKLNEVGMLKEDVAKYLLEDTKKG